MKTVPPEDADPETDYTCLICGRNFADEECTAELDTVVIPAQKNTPPGQQKKNK